MGNRNPLSASLLSLNAGCCAFYLKKGKKINTKEIVFDLMVSMDLQLFGHSLHMINFMVWPRMGSYGADSPGSHYVP